MINNFKKYIVILLAFSFIIPLFSFEVNGYSTNFATSTGWTIQGTNISIASNRLMLTNVGDEKTDMANYSISTVGSHQFDVNYTMTVTKLDVDYGRIETSVIDQLPVDTLPATLSSHNRIAVLAIGYQGARTLEVYYNSVLLSNLSLTLNVAYHIGFGYYQNPVNDSYYLIEKCWVSGSYSSPDISNIRYNLPFASIVPSFSQFIVCSHNFTGSYRSHSAYSSGNITTFSCNVFPDLSFHNIVLSTALNPFWPFTEAAGEESILLSSNGLQLNEWIASGPTTFGSAPEYTCLWYMHSTNAALNNFTTPVKVLDNIRFPDVVYDNGMYYCFALTLVGSDMYLWNSTNGINWFAMNSGNAILTHSSDPTSEWYYFWNPGVVFINHIAYMWVECTPGTIDYISQNNVRLGYTHSTISAMNFNGNRSENSIIAFGGNPMPYYVPNENAIMLIYGALNAGIGVWNIEIATVYCSADLANSSSYYISPYFSLISSIVNNADPSFEYVGSHFDNKIVMQYFHNQANVYEAFSNLTLDQFFNIINNGNTNSPVVNYPSSNFNDTGLAMMIIGCGMVFVGVIVKWQRKMNGK